MDDGSPTSASATETTAEADDADDAILTIIPSRVQRSESRPSFLRVARAAWGTAIIRAVVAFAATGLMAEALVSFAALAGRSHASSAVLAQTGGILFLLFHGVGLVVRPPRATAGLAQFGLVGGLDVTASAAVLLGTAVVVWLLWMGGRAVGARAGGPPLLRGLHGAKVAIPYAAMCFGVSFLLDFSVNVSAQAQLGLGTQVVTGHPVRLEAFFWPLVLGLVAGFSGAAMGARTREGEGERATGESLARGAKQGDRLRGALKGAWRMLYLALALSFAGLLILAAVIPHLTRAYTGAMFQAGPLRGLALVALNLLVVPNMAAWVLFPSMGACVGGAASFGPVSVSGCAVSYTSFGVHGSLPQIGRGILAGGITSAPTPAPYFLFVLVPLVAVLVGGWTAARTSGASTRREGALEGASAGLIFAALAFGLALMSEIVVRVQAGPSSAGPLGQGGSLRLGPFLLQAAVAALVWGVGGGAVGGLIPRPRPPGPPWQPAAGEPAALIDDVAPVAVEPGLPVGPSDALGL